MILVAVEQGTNRAAHEGRVAIHQGVYGTTAALDTEPCALWMWQPNRAAVGAGG